MDPLLTARLRLEPWSPEGGGLLVRLAALPQVMRHIGPGVTYTAAEAESYSARALAHWRSYGFGWRIAVERTGGRAVGLVALNLAGPDTPGLAPEDHKIGWWLDPSAWGEGYASEAGRAIVAEAFGRLGAPSVVARVQPGNTASLRVVAALGLTPVRHAFGRHGEPVRIFRRDAPTAAARGGPRG